MNNVRRTNDNSDENGAVPIECVKRPYWGSLSVYREDAPTAGETPPAPETLEEAVGKATKIDDPIDNVARGMRNIGQSWAVVMPGMVQMDGTTGGGPWSRQRS
ncbi:unnamed protein product [Phytophthora fragariaefolia]|uniref:Unnamed protein product n=1 Tax=Phytophthora fragariaefolia TaxID=1490495 RepID=A0A9W6Y533_9STRA|nr:unnamed protein product [Phytophthora fragariaefolia]